MPTPPQLPRRRPLMQAGTKEQLEKYLVPAVQNKIKIVFALTEPGAGSDAGSMVTTATKDGDYYVLNGRKCFISGAPIADYCIVYAKTDMTKGNKGISAFVVDMKAPGISCGKHEAKMGIVGYPTSDVVLEDVRVHKSDMLGKGEHGLHQRDEDARRRPSGCFRPVHRRRAGLPR